METTGISLGDAMNLCNRGDYYGNNAMWNNPFMYLMWASMFGCNGFGFGNRNFNGAEIESAKADIIQNTQAINDAQTLSQQIRGITNGLSSLGFALNNTVKDSAGNVTKAVNDVGTGMQMGFCNTNHNIDNLKYENAKNTEYIVNNAHADTQRVLDKLCNMELNAVKSENMELRQKLADERLTNSQFAQNAYLIEKLKPSCGC